MSENLIINVKSGDEEIQYQFNVEKIEFKDGKYFFNACVDQEGQIGRIITCSIV